MTQSSSTEIREDLPTPNLDQLQQDEPRGPTVPVRVEGFVTTHELPSRIGPVYWTPVDSTGWVEVLPMDPKRKRCMLIADVDILLSRTGTGNSSADGAPWYAKVALTVTHGDAVYAKTATGSAKVTTVTEIYSD